MKFLFFFLQAYIRGVFDGSVCNKHNYIGVANFKGTYIEIVYVRDAFAAGSIFLKVFASEV